MGNTVSNPLTLPRRIWNIELECPIISRILSLKLLRILVYLGLMFGINWDF